MTQTPPMRIPHPAPPSHLTSPNPVSPAGQRASMHTQSLTSPFRTPHRRIYPVSQVNKPCPWTGCEAAN
ncbi:hypothetical protein M011DRAFT_464521 [Sporormia fimetaria CBS 119925]|uniref:Uncharacterized protein n=1 Tax=Sporormia fimetaria CBS 119925 TaxID=1340428 RepID=A0A6A6VJA3_9PLEO|nr:hypothetical protein M011DRAFT_464521 [Sporormia fimetaria CBS 119925]